MTTPHEGSEREAPPEARATPTPVIGTMLRDARLHRGLTIAEAASDTRINPAYLEALEAERWELMPAPVYAKGFFRSYARYLGLPHEGVERLMPTNLPRPLDLEPAAGLRRRASEAPLSLPTLPALRWPTLAPPRRQRAPAKQTGGAVRVPRASSVAPAFARFTRVARRTGATSLRGAAALGRAMRQVDTRPALEWLRRIEPRVAAIAGGIVVALVLVLLAWTRFGGGDPSTITSGGGSGQVAGPEPTSAGGGAAPAVKDGEMPDLIGTPRKDAEATLTRLGLTFVVIEVANASAPPGTVYNHSPQAGKSIKRGDAVTLLVARAP